MTTRDLFNDIAVGAMFISTNVAITTTSSSQDIAGYEAAVVAFNVGLSGDTLNGSNFWTLSLTECDTSGGSYTAVAAADIIVEGGTLGTTSTYVVNKTGGGAGSDSQTIKMGYRGGKRFIKAVATKTGTMSTGTPIGIDVILGRAHVQPVPAGA